jgi:hypothetical protein
MPQWLIDFCSWLQQTPFSQTLQNVEWVVPALQTVHILSIGAVISSALVINLRMFGLLATDQPLARVSARFLRVIWLALPVLLVTGSMLISAEPLRSIGSPAFQLKMAMLVCVSIILLVYQGRLARATPGSLGPRGAPRGAPVLTVVSLLLWIGIIFAGRWIAYAAGK